MNPIVTYECHACGQTFSSELGLRAHDAVCIPRNMPAASNTANKLPLEVVADLLPDLVVRN
jgi:predicted RecB family endonuclease